MSKKPYAKPEVRSYSGHAIPEYLRERIAQLAREGLEGRVIAERLGIHRNTVYNWRLRLGLVVERERCPNCEREIRGTPHGPKYETCYVCRGYQPDGHRKRSQIDEAEESREH